MRRGDVGSVHQLECALFPDDAWTEEMFLSELALPGSRHYLVVEEGGQLIGYAGLAVFGKQGEVQTIAVHPLRWGAGTGSRLLTLLLDEAARSGCADVSLAVRSDNDRAQALYRRFGFQLIGVRPGYYSRAGVDGLVMRLTGVRGRVDARG
ncbi:MAG: ribosomal protein S18-alanine N-acetyltransferase [Streptomycetales bacterium]